MLREFETTRGLFNYVIHRTEFDGREQEKKYRKVVDLADEVYEMSANGKYDKDFLSKIDQYIKEVKGFLVELTNKHGRTQ